MRISIATKYYICINNCNNGEIIKQEQGSCDTILHNYIEGKRYTYYATDLRKMNIIYCGQSYVGYVTDEFIEKNFILEKDYNSNLYELDKLFDNLMS